MTEARVQRAIRIRPDAVAAIQTLADEEHRTWSQMARLLLSEALAARQPVTVRVNGRAIARAVNRVNKQNGRGTI